MTMMRRLLFLISMLTISILAACGPAASTSSGPTASATDSGGVAPGGGDIPDNQVYLAYSGTAFTIQYPEGWVQSARSSGVTFQDKDNAVRLTIGQSAAPSMASVRAGIRAIPGASITTDAHAIDLPGGAAVLATYQVDGPADPVTGKRPRLTVDHYELGGSAGRTAVLELANRLGDDNVDAYRLIAQSFRWR
jgi:hypothetical protein